MVLSRLLEDLSETFNDPRIEVVDEIEFTRTVKTKKVLTKPRAIARCFTFAAMNPSIEICGLLIGRIEGEYLVISKIHNCKKSKNSATSVEIDSQEMVEVSESLSKGEGEVGWYHSHPRFGIFLSNTDIKTQVDFQSIFPDSVALVIDPFSNGKIEFGFFRVEDGKPKKIDYAFLVRKDLVNANDSL